MMCDVKFPYFIVWHCLHDYLMPIREICLDRKFPELERGGARWKWRAKKKKREWIYSFMSLAFAWDSSGEWVWISYRMELSAFHWSDSRDNGFGNSSNSSKLLDVPSEIICYIFGNRLRCRFRLSGSNSVAVSQSFCPWLSTLLHQHSCIKEEWNQQP